ncbi:MAG: calcium:proton antiporter [Rhodoferax sp.]
MLKKYWPVVLPVALAVVLVSVLNAHDFYFKETVLALILISAIIASVHHAEIVAHRVGEPYGTLILALAVTVIETALILAVLLTAKPSNAVLVRDTVYAAVMIACNGVVGVCLLFGGVRHKEQFFRIEGTGPGFAALATMCVLVLVLPVYTTSSPEGTYTNSQLVFVAMSSLSLWLVFVFIQTIRHRDYFLPAESVSDEAVHASPPTTLAAGFSFVFLFVSLACVIGAAKLLSPSIHLLVEAAHAPQALSGVVIAAIVLLPEAWAAARAASANRLQTSMNLAIGSAMASIGLTIPIVVAACVVFHLPLTLGLEPKDVTLLMLTFLIGSITLGSGRTNVMQGAIHLVLFASFLFLTLVP